MGRRTLVYTALTFGFDAVGVNVTTVKFTGVVRFDRKFRSFRQEVSFAAFAATQDPLDPDEVPMGSGVFSGTGRRILAPVD